MPKETEQALRLSFVNHLAQVKRKRKRRIRSPPRPLGYGSPTPPKPLLEEFVRERLLQRSGDTGELVEVSHEAIFRCWDQLTKWLERIQPNSALAAGRRTRSQRRARFLEGPDTDRNSP